MLKSNNDITLLTKNEYISAVVVDMNLEFSLQVRHSYAVAILASRDHSITYFYKFVVITNTLNSK